MLCSQALTPPLPATHVHHQAAGHKLAGARLGEKGLEGVVLNGRTLGLLAVGLDAVLCVGSEGEERVHGAALLPPQAVATAARLQSAQRA